jgi:outer membrane biosynthesis protein TonB
MDNNDWKMPFNFALALHIIVLGGSVLVPYIFNSKPLYPDIYSVDLINVVEPLPETKPPVAETEVKPKVEQEQQPKSPPVTEKAVSIAEEQPAIEKVAEVAPVSIKPLKHKKVNKKALENLAAQKQQQLEKIRQQRLLEAREAERRAEEAAKIAANEAVNQLKEMLRETTTIESSQTVERSQPVSNRAPSGGKGIIERQYYASVITTLEPHWKPPAYKTWDPDLNAVIIIHVAQDGRITRKYFETKSGDRLFDQFVLNALKDGAPLPPIPAALNRSEIRLGLKFTVNSIQ